MLDRVQQEAGATMVEYGFMLAAIASACAFAVTAFGQRVLVLFQQAQGAF